jgi:hypothetical protein
MANFKQYKNSFFVLIFPYCCFDFAVFMFGFRLFFAWVFPDSFENQRNHKKSVFFFVWISPVLTILGPNKSFFFYFPDFRAKLENLSYSAAKFTFFYEIFFFTGMDGKQRSK